VILAGDIGGTHTRLALFDAGSDARDAETIEVYASQKFDNLRDIVRIFVEENPVEVDAACFGVAGPVHQQRAKISNLPWEVDGRALAELLGLRGADVIIANDLEATAHGIGALESSDFVTVNEGEPDAEGNQALIAAGTGLGEAGLYWDGTRHHPFPSEGGHTDFAPRNELEAELLFRLAKNYGRVSYERVVSGPGLVNIYRFLKDSGRHEEPPWLAEAIQAAGDDPAPVISRHALAEDSELCARSLELFVSIYGAEAGNLALKLMATGGVFVGGGIAPKILSKLDNGGFMEAFVAKSRLRSVLERVPVRVITRKNTALLGAARRARRRGESAGGH
jgi:glucokinase